MDTSKAPEDGAFIYGLYIEGARWSTEQQVLADSIPKVLYSSIPTIHLKPTKSVDIPKRHAYRCPVYKTSARRGTLSTTGHSTNYLIDIQTPMQKKHQEKFWIKRGVAMLTQLND